MIDKPIRVDTSAWTGLPSSVRRASDDPDDWAYPLTEAEDAQLQRDMRILHWRGRLDALRMLWGPPIVDEARTCRRDDGIVVYRRDRGEEWTFWRGCVATVAVILNRNWRDRDGWGRGYYDLGHWDGRSDGYGWSAMILHLCGGCRVDICSDGESWM